MSCKAWPDAISPNGRTSYIMSHGMCLRHVSHRSLKRVVRKIIILRINQKIVTQTPKHVQAVHSVALTSVMYQLFLMPHIVCDSWRGLQ